MTLRLWAGWTGLALGLLAVGCAGPAQVSDETRTLYVTQHPDTPPDYAGAILHGNIMVGMNEDMVKASWGEPTRQDPVRSNARWDEKWTYGNYLVNPAVTHLYFKAGSLVLYEFVDTQTQQTLSVSDPNERIALRSKPTGGSKSGPP